MRKLTVLFFLLMAVLSGVVAAEAHGNKDDCPPNSTDPDCK